MFSLYFLSLVPKSQLTCLTLFWGGCSKWGEALFALVGGLQGRQKLKHPSLDAASNLPRQGFPGHLLAPSQRGRLTPFRSPGLYSLGLCHAQLIFSPAGVSPG